MIGDGTNQGTSGVDHVRTLSVVPLPWNEGRNPIIIVHHMMAPLTQASKSNESLVYISLLLTAFY